MHLFTLAEKMRLWQKLHPTDKSSCHLCPINNEEYWSASICTDLIAIFQKRYNMPSTKQIYGVCPIPFMEREDFGE
jgi:hypothetical protein